MVFLHLQIRNTDNEFHKFFCSVVKWTWTKLQLEYKNTFSSIKNTVKSYVTVPWVKLPMQNPCIFFRPLCKKRNFPINAFLRVFSLSCEKCIRRTPKTLLKCQNAFRVFFKVTKGHFIYFFVISNMKKFSFNIFFVITESYFRKIIPSILFFVISFFLW